MNDSEKFKIYVDIYKHYSELIFKARISIITVIFLAYGYILGIIGHYVDKELDQVTTKLLIPICASGFMTLVFLLEVSYYKMFFKAVKSLKNLEKKSGDVGFFTLYDRKHWQFSILYLSASILYTVIFIYYREHFWSELTSLQRNLSIIGIFIPVTSIIYVFMLLVLSYYKIVFGVPVEKITGIDRIKILTGILSKEKIEKKYPPEIPEEVIVEKDMD